jgi:hypothetical protein
MMMAPSANDRLAQQNGFKDAATMLAWQRQKDLRAGPAIVIPGQSTPAELARQRAAQQPQTQGGWLSALQRISQALSQ